MDFAASTTRQLAWRGPEAVMTRLRFDDAAALDVLTRQGLTPDARPSSGQTVILRTTANAGRVIGSGAVDMVDGEAATQSNIAVLRFLLLPRTRRHSADFVKIPLELRDPNGLAVLAMIVCITPGTVWAELSRDRSMLMLHVLEVHDREAIVQHVQTRYERPLMEIFE